jgi:hypothetical protein
LREPELALGVAVSVAELALDGAFTGEKSRTLSATLSHASQIRIEGSSRRWARVAKACQKAKRRNQNWFDSAALPGDPRGT